MNYIHSRLLSQQLVFPQFRTPAEVVSYMCAVQAQDFRAGRWAVVMRTKMPSFKVFEDDFNLGRIVRLHLLRCTWQMIAGEDFGWMLELFAERAKSVLRGWMSSNRIHINPDEEDRFFCFLAEELARGKSLTKDEIKNDLADREIFMEEHRFSYHMRLAELSGLICSGRCNPLKNTYSLASEKIGVAPKCSCRDEALAKLAERYFISRSPATFDDFVWWSGLNVAECRIAVSNIAESLHCENWKGRDFFVHDKSRSRGFRKGSILLLPPYDEYLIGYKSRDIVLDPEFSHKAHNNSGIFKPIIVIDGEIVGNWSPTSKNGNVSLFKGDTLNDDTIDQIRTEFNRCFPMYDYLK